MTEPLTHADMESALNLGTQMATKIMELVATIDNQQVHSRVQLIAKLESLFQATARVAISLDLDLGDMEGHLEEAFKAEHSRRLLESLDG